MDRTFDAMGKLFGTTAQAVGKLLIAAKPVAGMVAGLVLDFDHLVKALPKWFLTDFMKVAATFMLIKTLLPALVGSLGGLNLGLVAMSAAIVALMPTVNTFLTAIGLEHTAQQHELAKNAKIAKKDYQDHSVAGMLQLSKDAAREAKQSTGAQQQQLQEQSDYYAWAAKQMAAGKPIKNFGQYTATTSNGSLVDRMWASVVSGVTGGSGPQVTVHVYVGGKEITDLVDTRIEHNNKKVATRVRSGKR
jgi:hypothetical protein